MPITTFVLIIGLWGPYGFVESSHYQEFPSQMACVIAGEASRAANPGSTGGSPDVPFMLWRCERGRVRPDLSIGWANW